MDNGKRGFALIISFFVMVPMALNLQTDPRYVLTELDFISWRIHSFPIGYLGSRNSRDATAENCQHKASYFDMYRG